MNVQELIAALQKHEPGASAQDAIAHVQAEADRAAMAYSLTPPGMRAMYAELHAHALVHTDGHGNSNVPEECALHAFNGVRTNVHWALQQEAPPPDPHEDDEGDPEMHHMRQKRHFKKLWQRTDALVAEAGITAAGVTESLVS